MPTPSNRIWKRVCALKAAASCARLSSVVSSLVRSFGFWAAIAWTDGGGGDR